jgi:hypothetical protein
MMLARPTRVSGRRQKALLTSTRNCSNTLELNLNLAIETSPSTVTLKL